MSNTYYEGPRWLSPNTPYEVGGRSTDVSIIAHSLRERVRSAFEGEVPPEIVAQLDVLEQHLQVSENLIDALIESVSIAVRTNG